MVVVALACAAAVLLWWAAGRHVIAAETARGELVVVHTEASLPVILAAQNRWPVPVACPGCGMEEVRYVAMIPARVAYQGKRAEKVCTSTEMHDPGFHGYRVDCVDCGTVAELADGCPLCQTPGPLRPRP
jgi:hypothetical protein